MGRLSVNPCVGNTIGVSTDLVPFHEYLLCDVKFEKLRVEVVDEPRNDIIDGRPNLLDDIRVIGGEVEEVGQVRDTILQRGLDEQRVHFLREDDWTCRWTIKRRFRGGGRGMVMVVGRMRRGRRAQRVCR